MKKVVFLLLGIVFAFKLQAKKINGTIIFGKDTLDVTFNIPVGFLSSEINFERLQYKVKYYDSNGKKITIRPHDAKEIRFTYNNETIHMLSRLNNFDNWTTWNVFESNTHIFLKLEIDGEVKLFKYFYKVNNGGAGMYNPGTGMTMGFTPSYNVERYVLQKREGELKRPRSMSFRKDMTEYFNECPELTRMIEEKEFRKGELESIVTFYNTKCKEEPLITDQDF